MKKILYIVISTLFISTALIATAPDLETYRMGAKSGSQVFPHKYDGFSEPEETHRWTEGNNATISIPIAREDNRRLKSVSFKAPQAFITPSYAQQLTVFLNGSIKFTSVLPFGGNNITNDIAIGLRTPLDDAEKIKKKFGCAFSNMISSNETIEVASVGGRKPRTLLRKTLADIIEPRVEEICSMIYEEIKKSGSEKLLASGVVLTGGCANLEGIPELAENIFNLPTRRGIPIGVGGLVDVVSNPIYATGVGLLVHGFKNVNAKKRKYDSEKGFKKIMDSKRLLLRMREWFKEIF